MRLNMLVVSTFVCIIPPHNGGLHFSCPYLFSSFNIQSFEFGLVWLCAFVLIVSARETKGSACCFSFRVGLNSQAHPPIKKFHYNENCNQKYHNGIYGNDLFIIFSLIYNLLLRKYIYFIVYCLLQAFYCRQ